VHHKNGNLNRNKIILLILCIIAGFALRFYTLDHKSLWIDEVHTFNDSRPGLKDHIRYFQEKPADYLHPPLFFLLTHLFYPFETPERDLRIIPLVFGILSIPMIYFLSRLFSPSIALPCTLSLAFMAYHISFSQDGRSYSLLMFLGMVALYFLLKHHESNQKKDLLFAALAYAISFYTNYTAIPFIFSSQLLWFYQINEQEEKPRFSSFLLLNAVTLLLCMPWILFVVLNYKSQAGMDVAFSEAFGSIGSILSNILNDWVPFVPLTIISVLLFILFPVFSKNRKNAFLLSSVLLFPTISLYLSCKFVKFEHYFSSRYVINFLPLFLILSYLSIEAIELKFKILRKYFSLKFLFLVLFIGSNVMILPLYYQAEKQDFRGLVRYLENELQDGDKIFLKSIAYIPGILHYFKLYPLRGRHYDIPYQWQTPEKKEFEARIPLISQNRKFTIYFSNGCFSKYVEDGSRLWIVAGVPAVKTIKEKYPCILKGYFDGSFCNFRKFPTDASMYLFLWDRKTSKEKKIKGSSH